MNEGRISETGTVVEVTGDQLVVVLSGSEACRQCGLCSRGEGAEMSIALRAGENPPGPGSRVRLVFPYRSVWKQSFFVFVLPLLLMLCGVAVAGLAVSRLGAAGVAGTLASVGGALVGLGLGAVAALLYEARFRKRVWRETEVEPLDAR